MSFDSLRRDLRYSLRVIRRNPGFAAAVAATFGLGVGATTAIFTVVSGVLLRPLPFPQPDRLVSIQVSYDNSPPNVFIGSIETMEWQKHSRTLSAVAAYFDCSVNLLDAGEAERLECGSVTASLLPLLGVQPILGRNFLPEEDRPGGPPAVILSHGLWQRRYGGDRAIIGRPLVLDGKSYAVVGVLPEGFQIPVEYRIRQDLWLPLQLQEGRANFKMVWAVGRLRPDFSLEAARAELDSLYQTTRRRGAHSAGVVLTRWQDEITGRVKTTLLIFMAAVGFVLLIACVNVANLLLSKATGRTREMAVRRALGAATGGIVRQLLAESILMAVGGALAGLALAFWSKDLLVAFLARSLPTVPPIPLDFRVLAFNLALALVCGIAFGLAPAVRSARVSLDECLRESARGAGGGRGRLGDVLVIGEVALATALMIGAALLFVSFLRVRGMNQGVPADRILTVSLELKGPRYAGPQAQAEYFHGALDRLRGIPGVEGAAVSTHGFWMVSGWPVEGKQVTAEWNAIHPDYFRIMGIPFLRGRNFAETDSRNAPYVAIVSQSLARRYYPNQDCLGARFPSADRKNAEMVIVGVVGDTRSELEREPGPTVYTSYLQQESSFSRTLLLGASGDPKRLVRPVRSRLADLDRTQAPVRFQTLEESMAAAVAPRRVNMLLLVSFALLATLLGAAGIYGVMAHAVGRRTHEIGVRIALGADRADIRALVVGRGLLLVAAGEAAGILGALGLNRAIARMLFGVRTTDPATYAAVAALWLVLGAAACYLPARRAMRVDPTVALRYE